MKCRHVTHLSMSVGSRTKNCTVLLSGKSKPLKMTVLVLTSCLKKLFSKQFSIGPAKGESQRDGNMCDCRTVPASYENRQPMWKNREACVVIVGASVHKWVCSRGHQGHKRSKISILCPRMLHWCFVLMEQTQLGFVWVYWTSSCHLLLGTMGISKQPKQHHQSSADFYDHQCLKGPKAKMWIWSWQCVIVYKAKHCRLLKSVKIPDN